MKRKQFLILLLSLSMLVSASADQLCEIEVQQGARASVPATLLQNSPDELCQGQHGVHPAFKDQNGLAIRQGVTGNFDGQNKLECTAPCNAVIRNNKCLSHLATLMESPFYTNDVIRNCPATTGTRTGGTTPGGIPGGGISPGSIGGRSLPGGLPGGGGIGGTSGGTGTGGIQPGGLSSGTGAGTPATQPSGGALPTLPTQPTTPAAGTQPLPSSTASSQPSQPASAATQPATQQCTAFTLQEGKAQKQGNKYQLTCDYGQNIDCISATTDGGNCIFKNLAGTKAVFECTPTAQPGDYEVKCTLVSGTLSNCCAKEDTATGKIVILAPGCPRAGQGGGFEIGNTVPKRKLFTPRHLKDQGYKFYHTGEGIELREDCEYEFDEDLEVRDGAGNKVLRFKARFQQGDVDIQQLLIKQEKEKTTADFQARQGVDTFTLFLPNLRNTGVFVCPESKQLAEVELACPNSIVFSHEDAGAGRKVGKLTAKIEGNQYTVEGLEGTGVGLVPLKTELFEVRIRDARTDELLYRQKTTISLAEKAKRLVRVGDVIPAERIGPGKQVKVTTTSTNTQAWLGTESSFEQKTSENPDEELFVCEDRFERKGKCDFLEAEECGENSDFYKGKCCNKKIVDSQGCYFDPGAQAVCGILPNGKYNWAALEEVGEIHDYDCLGDAVLTTNADGGVRTTVRTVNVTIVSHPPTDAYKPVCHEVASVDMCKTCIDGVDCNIPGTCPVSHKGSGEGDVLKFTLDKIPFKGLIDVFGGELGGCSLNGVGILGINVRNSCGQRFTGEISSDKFKIGENVLSCSVHGDGKHRHRGFQLVHFSYETTATEATQEIGEFRKCNATSSQAKLPFPTISKINVTLGDFRNEYLCTGRTIFGCHNGTPLSTQNTRFTGGTAEKLDGEVNYCKSDNTWSFTLDSDKTGCEEAFKGIAEKGWTGKACCGETSEKEEYYNDQAASCWNQTKVNNGTTAPETNNSIISYGGLQGCEASRQEVLNLKDKFTGQQLVANKQPCGPVLFGSIQSNIHHKCMFDQQWTETNNGNETVAKQIPLGEAAEQERGCCPRDECWDGETCARKGAFYTVGEGTNGFVCS